MPSSDHERSAVTPVSLTVRVDCACGQSYTVALPLAETVPDGPWGASEYAALEHAQQVHANVAENVSGVVHYVHDSDSSGAGEHAG